jgi:hypothetical protein
MHAGEGIPSPNLDFRKAIATHSLHTSAKIWARIGLVGVMARICIHEKHLVDVVNSY